MRFSVRGAGGGEIIVSLCKASPQHQRLGTDAVHREGLSRCKHPTEASTCFIDGAGGTGEERAQAQPEALAWTSLVSVLDQNPRKFERGHAGGTVIANAFEPLNPVAQPVEALFDLPGVGQRSAKGDVSGVSKVERADTIRPPRCLLQERQPVLGAPGRDQRHAEREIRHQEIEAARGGIASRTSGLFRFGDVAGLRMAIGF